MTAATWIAPPFTRTRRESDAWNALMSYAGQPLAVPNSKISLAFRAAKPPPGGTPALLVEPQQGGALVAAIAKFPFKALFGTDFGFAEVQELPEPLREALNRGVLAVLWAAVPDGARNPATLAGAGPLDGLAARAADGGDLQWLALSVGGVSAEPVELTLGLHAGRALEALFGQVPAARPVWDAIDRHITLDAAFTIGALQLRMSDLPGLVSGDIVVMPEGAGEEVIGLRTGESVYILRKSGDNWGCAEKRDAAARAGPAPLARGANAMAEADGAQKPGPALADLDVVLDFDLGQVTVSLADLRTWQVGSVVALKPPRQSEGVEVTVRANGRVVGSGDLVRIDDRIGVRLNRLLFAS